MIRFPKFNTVLFFANLFLILLLVLACIAKYVSNESFSFLTFLTLSVPALVLSNLLFLFYWIIVRRKLRALITLLALLFGYLVLGTFIKIGFGNETLDKEQLKVMSYNVRLFNRNAEINSSTVFEDTKAFIEKEAPDILCFQEPDYKRRKEFENIYPYHYLEYIYRQGKGILGIYSKYPIVNQGLLDFPNTRSSAAFADVLYKKDTIRVYSVHLESLGITPGNGTLRREPSDKLFKMLSTSFKKQQEQSKILKAHMDSSDYKTILCGDFNNNQYSNAYHTIKGDFNDTFLEAGSGYGRTLNFHGIPVRIDFILTDESFQVQQHTTYDVKYSDHYPIMATVELVPH